MDSRRRFFVRYDQLLSDWRVLAKRLGKTVGPSLPRPKAQVVAEIDGFLTLDLYRNKSTRDELVIASHVASTVVEMFDRMCEAADIGTETGLRYPAIVGRRKHQLAQSRDRFLRECLGVFLTEDAKRRCLSSGG